MTHNDICSPGLVPNSLRLTNEVIRACSFAANLKSSEKALELIRFFNEASAYLDREVLSEDATESEKGIVDHEAVSPFEDEPAKEKKVDKKKSK